MGLTGQEVGACEEYFGSHRHLEHAIDAPALVRAGSGRAWG